MSDYQSLSSSQDADELSSRLTVPMLNTVYEFDAPKEAHADSIFHYMTSTGRGPTSICLEVLSYITPVGPEGEIDVGKQLSHKLVIQARVYLKHHGEATSEWQSVREVTDKDYVQGVVQSRERIFKHLHRMEGTQVPKDFGRLSQFRGEKDLPAGFLLDAHGPSITSRYGLHYGGMVTAGLAHALRDESKGDKDA
ncbi:hypothetical protein M231_07621 [Tremella mesenterica]|uniref:Uncharacterized protein n=1 Tax=Tremella mesenterica TaxID=5217 RepID=A0A4Q1B8P5_TREME|nr:uncharacterized protein TREMEDRAFT_65073 [Tremella mesenterica DSM 1558]EIW66681.1 hypothetical protein TREMEDRAFT_65073 [Tremella mesenterica DSM 1558]RXK35128.1 hypothetical protein M231_07621 [Tremella mesenterica]